MYQFHKYLDVDTFLCNADLCEATGDSFEIRVRENEIC